MRGAGVGGADGGGPVSGGGIRRGVALRRGGGMFSGAMRRGGCGVLAWAALTTAARAQEKVDFAHDVVPLLKARCAEWHSNGKYQGSFSLDTRADLLKT